MRCTFRSGPPPAARRPPKRTPRRAKIGGAGPGVALGQLAQQPQRRPVVLGTSQVADSDSVSGSDAQGLPGAATARGAIVQRAVRRPANYPRDRACEVGAEDLM